MDCTNSPRCRPRVTVLILSHSDGILEVFGEACLDVHLVRVPVAFSRQAEIAAEDVVEMLLPPRFQPLFRRDRLRATGTTAPLIPSSLRRSIDVQECLALFNMVHSPESEAMAWTL